MVIFRGEIRESSAELSCLFKQCGQDPCSFERFLDCGLRFAVFSFLDPNLYLHLHFLFQRGDDFHDIIFQEIIRKESERRTSK